MTWRRKSNDFLQQLKATRKSEQRKEGKEQSDDSNPRAPIFKRRTRRPWK
jgi:hypothetical protein